MKLFLPEATLETWAASEQADLKDGKLWISRGNTTYPLQPAVHFRSLASGTDDLKLLCKVKTDEQLKALGAEHLMDSVLLGETAYEVTNGYLAEVVAPSTARPGARPSGESEMLAAFLLEKLT